MSERMALMSKPMVSFVVVVVGVVVDGGWVGIYIDAAKRTMNPGVLDNSPLANKNKNKQFKQEQQVCVLGMGISRRQSIGTQS